MGLKTITVTISDENRDKGKKFLVTEIAAIPADEWIMRAIFGFGKAGVEIPPEALKLGAAPLAYIIGSQAMKLPSRLGLKLARELLDQVQRVEPAITRSLVPNDTEEWMTLMKLKAEVLKLTFGFFVGAASPTSDQGDSGDPALKP